MCVFIRERKRNAKKVSVYKIERKDEIETERENDRIKKNEYLIQTEMYGAVPNNRFKP